MASRHSGHRNPASRHGPATVTAKRVSSKRKTRLEQAPIPLHKHSIPKDLRRVHLDHTKVLTYVIDTNVFMSDWTALFKFEEHEVYIVDQVWRELDKHKEGFSDKAYNTRRTISAIDTLMGNKTASSLQEGVVIVPPPELENGKPHTGKLFLDFSKPTEPENSTIELHATDGDDKILMSCLALKQQGKHVVLVTNDGNFRVKAACAGIEAEEYLSDAVIKCGTSEEDTNQGFHLMPPNFWENTPSPTTAFREHVHQYTIESDLFRNVHPNEFLLFQDETKLRLIVTSKPQPNVVIAETFTDYSNPSYRVWGITPLNVEQELALHLLMDERISAVSLAGLAGSGKTLLALGAGLEQVFERKTFKRIIMTRPTVSSGEDIGFLPGTEEEKMNAWMGALSDNLEILTSSASNESEEPNNRRKSDTDWRRETTDLLLRQKIHIKSINFMKGRTFINTWFIIDETQDLSRKSVKMLATRLGPGSKIIFLGNVAQIDSSFLTEHTSGLSVFIRTFRESNLAGHITLQQGERHPFATLAERLL